MSKDIKIISVDSILEDWLIDELRTNPPKSSNAEDLLQGLEALRAGNIHSLLLDSDENAGSAPSLALDPDGLARSIHSLRFDTDERAPRTTNIPGVIMAGDLEIQLKSRRVTYQGREISLTPKEFDILYFLAENKGEVFTKEQIYNAVWSEAYLLDDSNIMAFIRKLRKKIEPDPDNPRYILTIWGIGYKFNDAI